MEKMKKNDRIFYNSKDFLGQLRLYWSYFDRGLMKLENHLKNIRSAINSDDIFDLREKIKEESMKK